MRKKGERVICYINQNPLPSGMPSPELGADPTLFSAATIPQTILVKTNRTNETLTILFILFYPSFNLMERNVKIILKGHCETLILKCPLS